MKRQYSQYVRHLNSTAKSVRNGSDRSLLVRIANGTFYRQHPAAVDDVESNPPLFPHFSFSLPRGHDSKEIWSIVGPSSSGKTTLLEILQGKHLCFPPNARSYPYLAAEEVGKINARLRMPSNAIQCVGFGEDRGGLGSSPMKGAYLSARYESRREDDDFTLLDYLKGQTELNPSEHGRARQPKEHLLSRVIEDLDLGNLVVLPTGNLSNGQTHRARVAKALLQEPLLLLLDEPFMGLDPPSTAKISALLGRLAQSKDPQIMLSLRSQDPVPSWVTHLIRLSAGSKFMERGPAQNQDEDLSTESQAANHEVSLEKLASLRYDGGTKDLHHLSSSEQDKFHEAEKNYKQGSLDIGVLDTLGLGDESRHLTQECSSKDAEPLVEMSGVKLAYGDRQVLGNWVSHVNGKEQSGLWWQVRRGERWGIFGPNGSGKTTILSLICSDHPQTYSLPVRLFGRTRLPEPGQPGISLFDIQSRIGHSSPEVHHFFPRQVSLRKILQNAWADTFLGKAEMNPQRENLVDACLQWFKADLCPANTEDNSSSIAASALERSAGSDGSNQWADNIRFREIPFSSQRVALFLRAIIKSPDLLIMDEAFSGMDEQLRDKCMLFLEYGETRSFHWPLGRERDDRRVVVTSETLKEDRVKFSGMQDHQALICVSHVKEEVPPNVRQWICLPEANEGRPARTGTLRQPLQSNDSQGWKNIWGQSQLSEL